MKTVQRHEGGESETIEEILARERLHNQKQVRTEDLISLFEDQENSEIPVELWRCPQCEEMKTPGIWILDHLRVRTAHLVSCVAQSGGIKRTSICGMKFRNPIKAEFIIEKYGRKWV